jgi:hypothetical protein
MFRMDTIILMSLYYDLKTQYRLKTSRRMNVIEKVTTFLCTITIGALNREV